MVGRSIKIIHVKFFLPKNIEELKDFLKNNKFKKNYYQRHGCSNGDQSVLTDGIVVDMCHINKVIDYDKKGKIIEVESELS